MPEQTISPGVFTEERDQTFLQQGVQEIGGAFVGPTQKGPAFKPIEVSSPQEYEEQFGNEGLYMDYSTRNYLRDASSATVVRLLGEEGYQSESVEIQLPAGELSKRSFEVSKAEFSFGNKIDPEETIEVKISFRGRQRRSSETDALKYDLKIHEYVDGDWNGTVVEQNDLDQDAFSTTFTPISEEKVDVTYEIEAERIDGQLATAESPVSEIAGFHLDSVDYNWNAGKEKGMEEIVSLAGTVDNLQGDPYDINIYEIIDGTLQENPIATRKYNESGQGETNFCIGWVHGGSEGERITYAVEAKQGEVESVPDEVSPPIDVISRSPVSGFQILDVNWNFVEDQKVDYGQKLQVDAEANAPVGSEQLYADQDPNDTTFEGTTEVSGDPNGSSIYIEYEVGDGGLTSLSTGNVINYILEVVEQETNNPTTKTNTSPQVEVDGGLFRIDEISTDFAKDGIVTPSGFSGVAFSVVNEDASANEFNFQAFEVINGGSRSQLTGITDLNPSLDVDPFNYVEEYDDSENTVLLGLPHNASPGDNVEFEIQVTQDVSQGASIASTDTQRTESQTVDAVPPLPNFGVKKANFSFSEGDTVEDLETLFGNFDVTPGATVTYDYEVVPFKNGTEVSGKIVDSDTANPQDSYFIDWEVSDTEYYNGDEIYWQIKLFDGTNSLQDTFNSPKVTYEGQNADPEFGIDNSNFHFRETDEIDVNERLSVHFDTRRPSWTSGGEKHELRYRVNQYVNGAASGTVVSNVLQERSVEFIEEGNGSKSSPVDPETDFETSWYVGESGTVRIGDEVEYELVVEQYNAGNESVEKTETVSSETVTVTEKSPNDDVTLAVLSPTRRLRRDGDEVLDAQINPNKSDITGFELILGLESTSPNNNGGQASTDSMEESSPVEQLVSDTDNQNMMSSQDITIDGKSYQLSFKEGDSNYLLDFFGEGVDSPLEVYARNSFPEVWEELIQEHYGESGISLSANYDAAKLDFEDQGFDGAETPWIVSQDQQPNQSGAQRQKLFKFETIGEGNYSNTDVKVSIRNIRYPSEVAGSDYGEFDVVVRDIEDSDRDPTIYESFNGVNLDPESPNYISRIVGNRKTVLTESGKLKEKGGEAGIFENASSYIRVRVHPEVVRANQSGRNGLANLVPWGFQPYQIPLDYAGQVPHGVKPRLVQSVNDVDHDILPEEGINPDTSTASAPFDNRIHFGFDFDWDGNMNWLAPIAENSDSASEQDEFLQDFGFVLSDAYVENPDGEGVKQIQYGDSDSEGLEPNRRKFNVAFQGGFDGKSPAKPQALEDNIRPSNSQGLDLSGPDASGTNAYERAIGILGNEDLFDINLLVTPGVLNSLHSPVVQTGIDMVEQRTDCFYVFDAAGVDATVDRAISSIESVDTSYAATYYPWMRIRDQNRNKQVRVPPSVLIPRVYAFNDQTSAEWFAPAGFERGGVPEAISAVVRLRREDRDELYRNRVNPIAQFPGQGVSVWGQKTLQTQASALDRVNVRRLLIRVKKFIASSSRFLVFEQNVPETRNRFLNIVNPFLDQVKQQNGLYAFRVKMDGDNNTPEVVDRNKLVGEIFLQPTRTAEFIELTFNVLPTGAEFEDI